MSNPGIDLITSDEGPERLPRSSGPRTVTAGVRATAMSAALSLVLAGGVATAVYRGSQSGTDPATLIPASAFAVATIDLSAPGDALGEFADHFPHSPTKTGDGSALDRLLRAMLKDSENPHVDYDKDVKPWLGDHVAAAAWLDSDDHVRGEFLLQSTNDDAARQHLGAAFATLDSPPAMVMRDGYVVLSDTKEHVTSALDEASKSSIATAGTYAADIALLPAGQAAIGWADGHGVEKALTQAFGGMNPLEMTGPFSILPMTANPFAGRFAVGVHVTGNTAQVDMRTVGSSSSAADAPSTLLTELPSGTIGAIEMANPGPVVTAATKFAELFLGIGSSMTCGGAGYSGTVTVKPRAFRHHFVVPAIPPGTPHRKATLRRLHRMERRLLRSNTSPYPSQGIPVPSSGMETCTPSAPPSPLKGFEAATGLSLPDDLNTLLGDRAVIAFGGLNITSLPDIAVRSHPTALSSAQALASTLHDKLQATSGVDLGVTTAGDDLIVASSSSYASKVATSGDLGGDETFTAAMGQVPDRVSFAAYVDLSRVWPIAGVSADDGVHHLHSIGLWADTSGDVQRAQMRLVVD